MILPSKISKGYQVKSAKEKGTEDQLWNQAQAPKLSHWMEHGVLNSSNIEL